MPDDTITILVVDSHVDRRETTIEQLEQNDRFTLYGANSIDDAKRLIDRFDIDCIVSEEDLVDGLAVDIFAYAAKKKPEVGRIVLTADEQTPLLMEATELVYAYVDMLGKDTYERLRDLIQEGYDNNAFAPYPVPENEKERLDVMEQYRVRASDYLDDLVAQAADEFGVEKASVRLIERESQEYLACEGFDADHIPRSDTICTYNIIDDDVLVVEHVQSDPRFKDVELFKEMNIDWYAGAVIKIEGENIGTFCLEDSEQHEFTEKDKERLNNYAVRASALIALEKAFKDPRTSTVEEAVRKAQESAEIGPGS